MKLSVCEFQFYISIIEFTCLKYKFTKLKRCESKIIMCLFPVHQLLLIPGSSNEPILHFITLPAFWMGICQERNHTHIGTRK